jgi:aminotransferase
VPIFVQEAGVEALRNSSEAVASMRDSYRRRRDFLVRRFREMGLACHMPQATFYTFPDVTPTGLDGKTFATRLLQASEVAVVPGTAFGKDGSDFVRASFSTRYEKIEEACTRMQGFIDSL